MSLSLAPPDTFLGTIKTLIVEWESDKKKRFFSVGNARRNNRVFWNN